MGTLVKDRLQCTVRLRATKAAVPASRMYIVATLEAWALTHLKDDAILIADELVSNAIRFSSDLVTLSCSISDDDEFVIEVGDPSPELPRIGITDELEIDGRGLIIVEALSEEWGAHLIDDGGKVVWATLSRG